MRVCVHTFNCIIMKWWRQTLFNRRLFGSVLSACVFFSSYFVCFVVFFAHFSSFFSLRSFFCWCHWLRYLYIIWLSTLLLLNNILEYLNKRKSKHGLWFLFHHSLLLLFFSPFIWMYACCLLTVKGVAAEFCFSFVCLVSHWEWFRYS